MTTENTQNTTDQWLDKVREAVKGATVSRGKRKGKLKAKCPPMGSLSAAAWLGIMINARPGNVGMVQMLTMTDEGREIFHFLDKRLSLLNDNLDRVINEIEER